MSTSSSRSAAQCRELIDDAGQAIGQLLQLLWQIPGNELGATLGQLDALAAAAAGARLAVTTEAQIRGEIADSQAPSVAGWVAQYAPTLAATGSTTLARVMRETIGKPDLAAVHHAAVTGALTLPVAVTVLSEYASLRPLLHDEAAPTVLDALVTMGTNCGSAGVRRLRPALLATYGADDAFQRHHDRAHTHRALSHAVGDDAGTHTYHLTLDTEGHAVLEAALGPLSAPTPGPDGAPDPRNSQQRRADALVQLCRCTVQLGRSSARLGNSGTATSTREVPVLAGVKTTLLLTMSLAHLTARIGAATALGTPSAGQLLPPETVRRLACDAAVIPVVLGSRGEILDQGRAVRLATTAQLVALWHRDRRCTFPGCTIPAHWTDAHHIRHWVDDGPTDLTNLTLLCGRHHTVVHRDQLHASLVDGHVVWDTTPGSYGRALSRGSV